eukprot:TRINITY_DN3867_c0_g1_i6.p4 TRINITY_DN3867_c0_g1~~TRINITY_DN3867_c0_g1_i6.p4  ORF type:complete len:108 (-),score=5.66 TRINITY_DN3867_c0_g1_i6:311-634(-)
MYVPGLPFMYSHMMRQRRKALGAKPKAAAEVMWVGWGWWAQTRHLEAGRGARQEARRVTGAAGVHKQRGMARPRNSAPKKQRARGCGGASRAGRWLPRGHDRRHARG